MAEPQTVMTPEFMDPPAPGQPDSEWQPTVDILKQRTGRWAVIFEDKDDDGSAAAHLSGRIRRRRGVWAGEEWEVTVRKVGPLGIHGYRVFARHLSPEQVAGERGE
jgi:hypothetical protein